MRDGCPLTDFVEGAMDEVEVHDDDGGVFVAVFCRCALYHNVKSLVSRNLLRELLFID